MPIVQRQLLPYQVIQKEKRGIHHRKGSTLCMNLATEQMAICITYGCNRFTLCMSLATGQNRRDHLQYGVNDLAGSHQPSMPFQHQATAPTVQQQCSTGTAIAAVPFCTWLLIPSLPFSNDDSFCANANPLLASNHTQEIISSVYANKDTADVNLHLHLPSPQPPSTTK